MFPDGSSFMHFLSSMARTFTRTNSDSVGENQGNVTDIKFLPLNLFIIAHKSASPGKTSREQDTLSTRRRSISPIDRNTHTKLLQGLESQASFLSQPRDSRQAVWKGSRVLAENIVIPDPNLCSSLKTGWNSVDRIDSPLGIKHGRRALQSFLQRHTLSERDMQD